MALKFLKYFLPKDKVFYNLFEQAGTNLESMAKLLNRLVNEPKFQERQLLIRELEDLEHANDEVTHHIFQELGLNFITPFDREDIHSLAQALDDIADFMYASGKKINFYKIDPNQDTGIVKMATVIEQSVLAVSSVVGQLRNLKNTEAIVKTITRINEYENHADDLFDLSIERLFEDQNDAILLIKLKEIYQTMEEVTDRCEDAANVIESIVVKYA